MTNKRSPRLIIPEIPLSPLPTSDEARSAIGFKWASEGVGLRHKLGGEPDWLQEGTVPTCPSCFATMSFYAQLDSIGDAFTLADCGMVYVFVCFDCFTTSSILQSS